MKLVPGQRYLAGPRGGMPGPKREVMLVDTGTGPSSYVIREGGGDTFVATVIVEDDEGRYEVLRDSLEPLPTNSD
jgi:hypothetical protein